MADILGEKKKTSITSLNKTSKVYVYNVVTKEWRSRTCELNGSYLSFYRKEKIVAVIDLEQVGDISPVTNIPEDDIIKDTVFTISLKEDRNFMIRTISSDECISWICILQEVRDKLRSQLSRKSNASVTSSSHNTFDRLMSSDDVHDSAIDNGSSDKIEDYFDNEVKLDGNILSPIPISHENSTVEAKNKPAAGSVVNNIKKRFSFGTALSSTFSMGSIGSPNNLISSPQARRVSFSFPMTDKQLLPPPSSCSISKCKIKCNESVLHGNNNSINTTKAISSSTKADGPHGKDNTIMLVASNPLLDNDNQKVIVSVLSPADNKKRSDVTRNIVIDENKENMHMSTQSEDKSTSTVVGSSHMMSPKKKLLLLNESVEGTPTHSSTVVVVEHQKGNEVHSATVASISTSPMNISCIDASHRLIAPRVNVRAPNYRTPERKSSFVNRTSLGTQTPNFRRPLKAPYQSCFDVWATSSIPLSYVVIMVAVAVLVGSFISSFYITQHYEVAIRNGQLITAGSNALSTTINLLPTIQPSVGGSSMDHIHHACEVKTKVDFENNSPFARNLRQVQAKSSSPSSASSSIIKGSSALNPLDAADIGSSSAAFDQLVSRPRAEVVSQQIKPSTSPLQVIFQVLRDSFRLLSDIKGRIMSFFSFSRVVL